MTKEIVVEIGPEGDVRFETRGFRGAECEAETRDVERALGRVTRTQRTREYGQRPEQKREVKA